MKEPMVPAQRKWSRLTQASVLFTVTVVVLAGLGWTFAKEPDVVTPFAYAGVLVCSLLIVASVVSRARQSTFPLRINLTNFVLVCTASLLVVGNLSGLPFQTPDAYFYANQERFSAAAHPLELYGPTDCGGVFDDAKLPPEYRSLSKEGGIVSFYHLRCDSLSRSIIFFPFGRGCAVWAIIYYGADGIDPDTDPAASDWKQLAPHWFREHWWANVGCSGI